MRRGRSTFPAFAIEIVHSGCESDVPAASASDAIEDVVERGGAGESGQFGREVLLQRLAFRLGASLQVRVDVLREVSHQHIRHACILLSPGRGCNLRSRPDCPLRHSIRDVRTSTSPPCHPTQGVTDHSAIAAVAIGASAAENQHHHIGVETCEERIDATSPSWFLVPSPSVRGCDRGPREGQLDDAIQDLPPLSHAEVDPELALRECPRQDSNLRRTV
jgi:hypothetical protein